MNKTLIVVGSLILAQTSFGIVRTYEFDAPTQRVGNTALTNLMGYRVYNNTVGSFTQGVGVVTQFVAKAAAPTNGTTERFSLVLPDNTVQYVTVTSVDQGGLESTFSNVIQEDLNPPKPPSLLRKIINIIISWFTDKPTLRSVS